MEVILNLDSPIETIVIKEEEEEGEEEEVEEITENESGPSTSSATVNLFSPETLDRASPEIWPEKIPGLSKFTPLPRNNESPPPPPPWRQGITTKEEYAYVHKLATTSVKGLIMEVKKLHDIAHQLGVEESKEITRGKYLNVFPTRRQR